MRVMAGHATFPQSFMREYKRSPLFDVALETDVVSAHDIGCAAAFEDRPLVRVVAIRAIDSAFRHRVVIRQIELGADLQVALEACLGIFAGVDYRVRPATGTYVQAARAMTGLAPHIFSILAFGHEPRVVRGLEILGDVSVAIFAGLRSHESRPGHAGRHHERLAQRAARDHNNAEQGKTACDRQNPGHPGLKT